MASVQARDACDLDCNCTRSTLINGDCPYNNKCRDACVMCRAVHLKTGKVCIGNASRFVKTRMQEHYGLLVKAIERIKKAQEKVKSDTFASSMSEDHARAPKNRFFEKDFRIDVLA